MTLPFSIELNRQPTHFVEKIWAGLIKYEELGIQPGTMGNYDPAKHDLWRIVSGNSTPKLHTIRKDEKDLWKAGRDIHMVLHNRTPKRLQFAPVVKCLSVQEIEIYYHDAPLGERIATVYIDRKQHGTAIWKESKLIHNSSRLDSLAANDGFDSVEAFFEYFDKGFTGKIIHWTNLKY